MMELVLWGGSLWALAASLIYLLIVKDPEPSVYRIQERILYEDRAQHHFVITGQRKPVRLTKDQAFTNALIAAAQERRASKNGPRRSHHHPGR